VLAAPGGGAALVEGWSRNSRGAWIADVPTGRKLRFLPPWVVARAWKSDGSCLAVVTDAGPLGSVRGDPRVEFYGRDGAVVRRAVPLRDSEILFKIAWSGDDLVGIGFGFGHRSASANVIVLKSGAGAWVDTGFERPAGSLWPMRTLDDGRVALLEIGADRGSRVHVVDAAHGKVEGPIFDLPAGETTDEGDLSPSGNLLLAFERAPEGPRNEASHNPGFIHRAGTATTLPGPSSGTWHAWHAWLADDRLAWVEWQGGETTLKVQTRDGRVTSLKSWTNAAVGLDPSPDGNALFVSVLPQPDKSGIFEELVYLADESRLVSLGPPFSDRLHDLKYTLWAGPRTLARIAPGVVAFEDVDALGKRRFVLGSERNLR